MTEEKIQYQYNEETGLSTSTVFLSMRVPF